MREKFQKYMAKKSDETFIIEEDLPEVGWYLLRTDSEGNQKHDYLQNTLQDSIDFANSEFYVDPETWTKIE